MDLAYTLLRNFRFAGLHMMLYEFGVHCFAEWPIGAHDSQMILDVFFRTLFCPILYFQDFRMILNGFFQKSVPECSIYLGFVDEFR